MYWEKINKKMLLLGVLIVFLLIIVFLFYPFLNIESKIHSWYDTNEYRGDGSIMTWEGLIEDRPNEIVKTDFSFFNPVYSIVLYDGPDSFGDGMEYYSIETIHFKRKLFSFEVREVYTSSVIASDNMYNELVEAVRKKDFKKYEEGDFAKDGRTIYLNHYGNPTPEQQAQDEEWRTLKKVEEYFNPSGDDAIELYEASDGRVSEEMRLASTGETFLRAEENIMSGMTSRRVQTIDWVNDEQIVYLSSRSCVYYQQPPAEEGEVPSQYIEKATTAEDNIVLYDTRDQSRTVIYSQAKEDRDCMIGTVAYANQIAVVTYTQVLLIDREGQEIARYTHGLNPYERWESSSWDGSPVLDYLMILGYKTIFDADGLTLFIVDESLFKTEEIKVF